MIFSHSRMSTADHFVLPQPKSSKEFVKNILLLNTKNTSTTIMTNDFSDILWTRLINWEEYLWYSWWVILHANLTELRDAQRANKTLFLDVSVRVPQEDISMCINKVKKIALISVGRQDPLLWEPVQICISIFHWVCFSGGGAGCWEKNASKYQ